MKLSISILVVAFWYGFTPAHAEEEGTSYVVIANKDVPGSSITLTMLKRIYLKDMTNWEGGGNVVPVDLDDENSLRSSFSRKVFGKGVDEMKSYWINQKLTNNISPPVSMKNSKAAKKFVSQNGGAIGYVRQSEADSSVKVLTIEP